MGKQQEDIGLNEDRRKQLDSNIQNMLSSGASNEDVAKYAMDFKSNFGVKKKDLSQGSGNTSQNGQPTLPSGGITDLSSLASGSKISTPTPLTPKGVTPYKQGVAKQQKDIDTALGAFEQAQGVGSVERIQEVIRNQPVGQIRYSSQDPSAMAKSVKNSFSNLATSLKGVVPRLDLVSTSALEKTIGKDNAKSFTDFLNYNPFTGDQYGRDFTTIQNEALDRLDELSTQTLPTQGVLENVRNFNVPGLAAATVDAFTSLAATAIPSVASGGTLLASEMIGGSLYDYNDAKAKAKGVDIKDLYEKGEADFAVPAFLGSVAFGLEKIGLKGIEKGIKGKLVGNGYKKAMLLANDPNKEGLTEWVQVGIDTANNTIGQGGSAEEATRNALDAMFSAQGMEAYAKGALGSGVAIGGGRLAQKLVNPKSKTQLVKLEETKQAALQDLSNDNVPIGAKEAIVEALVDTEAKIDDLVNKDFKATENLSEEQRVQVQEVNQKIADLDIAIPTVSEATKPILEEQKKVLETELKEIIDNPKGEQDALQIESPTEVSEQPETRNSEEVQQGNEQPNTKVNENPVSQQQEATTEMQGIGDGSLESNVTEEQKMQFGAGYRDYDFNKQEIPLNKVRITEQPSLSERQDLVEDVKANGVKEPIVVQYDTDDDLFYVKNGNHRTAAALQSGQSSIPAIVATLKQESNKQAPTPTEATEQVQAEPTINKSTTEQLTIPQDRIAEIQVKRQSIKDSIKAKPKAQRGQLSSGFDPSLIKDFVEIGATYAEEGVVRAEDFIKRFREDYRDVFGDDKDITDEEIKAEVFDKVVEPSKPKPLKEEKQEQEDLELIGITKKEAQRLRTELGEEQYEYEVQSRVELVNKANKLLESGFSVPNLIKRLEVGGIASAEEVELLRQYFASLTAKINKSPTPELIQERKDLLSTLDLSKTRAGRAVQAFDGFIEVEDNLADFLDEESQYGDLTSDEVKELTEKYNKAKEAKDKLQEQYDKLLEEAKNKAAKAEIAKQQRKAKSVGIRQDFKEERKAIVADFRAELKKIRTTPSAVILPYQRELIALVPFAKKMTESYVKQGITELKTITKGIYDEFKEDIPELTENDVRDIIAGRYSNPKKTKNAKLAIVRDLEQQAKLLAKLDDLERGISKTPNKVTRQQSQEVKDLRNAIKEIQKRNPELVYPSKLEGRKTWFKNQIDKLKAEIAKGEFDPIVEPVPITLDAEAIKLKDEYIAFREETRLRREKKLFENRTKLEKAYDNVQQVLGLRRLIQTSIDVSIPFRQGVAVMLNPRTMKIGSKGYVEMWQSLFSSKEFQRKMFDIKENPVYGESLNDGVVYTEVNSMDNLKRDEEFRDSFLFKIPYLRVPFRASERAAASWTNFARLELYRLGAKRLDSQGKTRESDPQAYKDMAARVMVDTGRGKIPGIADGSQGSKEGAFVKRLGGLTFYGLRLMSASFRKLNPLYYLNPKVDKTVRVEALKDMVGYTASLIVLGLAATAVGFSVSFDEDDPDFLKLRKGKKVIDITGGQANYIRTFVRIMKAAYMRADPTVSHEDAKKYSSFATQSVRTFFRNKLAPNTAYAMDYFVGENSIGEKFNPYDILKFYPMYTEDMIDALKSDTPINVIPMFITEAHGIGAMEYEKDIRRAFVKDYLSEGKDDKVINFLKKKQLNIKGDINQEFYYTDKESTVRMTEEQSDRYERIWSEYVVESIEGNLNELNKLDGDKLNKEISKIKTQASYKAKESVMGFVPEDRYIEVDNTTRVLNKEQLLKRIVYNKEYKDDFGEDLIETYTDLYKNQNNSPIEAKLMAERKVNSLAREYSKKMIISEVGIENLKKKED